MNLATIKSPGVYINEINGFGNSVVPVQTDVPAFIGYTPQATHEGVSYTNKPTKISSFADFLSIFCLPDAAPPADPTKQYQPQYYLLAQDEQPKNNPYVMIGNVYYAILPDPYSIYYLYNSVRLFYDNGGGDAYIVSVGTYGANSGKPMDLGTQIVNPNVKLEDLKNGLALLKNELEPTMYVFPESTLLSLENNATLMQLILSQCEEMQTAIAIFDLIGGNHPDPIEYTKDIENFRNATGSNGLSYGTAYYPFVETTIMQASNLDYTNLFGGDIKQLASIINPSDDSNSSVGKIISEIEKPTENPLTVSQYNNALIIASANYSIIINQVLAEANILPASGGMAGVITKTDHQVGPWQAPANTSIVSVVDLPIRLDEQQQANLNVDALSGKSINAIRFFNGLGVLIWGARTLDGNSMDWRYLSVRRTMIYLEQSCKSAAQAYAFSPNSKNTWEAVKSMIGSFLTSVWQAGGLQGATPADAFTVECGLGSTMTADDILNGFMNVTIKVAVTRPAEFIIISFQQRMSS